MHISMQLSSQPDITLMFFYIYTLPLFLFPTFAQSERPLR